MGPLQMQQPDWARPAGSVCVLGLWVVGVLLFFAVLAGDGCCQVLYLTLPPVQVSHWLLAVAIIEEGRGTGAEQEKPEGCAQRQHATDGPSAMVGLSGSPIGSSATGAVRRRSVGR